MASFRKQVSFSLHLLGKIFDSYKRYDFLSLPRCRCALPQKLSYIISPLVPFLQLITCVNPPSYESTLLQPLSASCISIITTLVEFPVNVPKFCTNLAVDRTCSITTTTTISIATRVKKSLYSCDGLLKLVLLYADELLFASFDCLPAYTTPSNMNSVFSDGLF